MHTHNNVNTTQFFITLAAVVIVAAGMSAAKAIIVPFLLALFIAIISAPPLFWLQSKKIPTWLALIIVISGVLVIVILMAGIIGSSVKDFSNDLPFYESRLKEKTSAVMLWIEKSNIRITDKIVMDLFNPGAAMKLVAYMLNGLGNVLANSFLILMTVIFMLLEASGFSTKLRFAFGSEESSHVYYKRFIKNVKQYMAIKTIVSLATGVFIAIWLALLGVDYPILWGLFAFVLNYVPNIGSIIAAVPAVFLAIIQLSIFSAVLTAAGYIGINLLMGNIVEPRFMGRGLGLSPLVVFLSLLFWGWILGPVGMLLSVPLTITAKIALDSREDTRWLAVLLGPEISALPEKEDSSET